MSETWICSDYCHWFEDFVSFIVSVDLRQTSALGRPEGLELGTAEL